jgi:hypothetical protein
LALRSGIRTTVVSRATLPAGAGVGELPCGVCGFDAERGSWWRGPADVRASGCKDDEGRCVTK